MKKSQAKNLMGCCGICCGLCSKFQSKAPSRCIGCQLGEQHSWCSIWNCCVKKHGFETCAQCSDLFKCPIFVRRKVAEWVPAADNLRQIKRAGLDSCLREQVQRQALLENLLQDYNEGRSMSFYCRACARMPIDLIDKAIEQAKQELTRERVDQSDIKTKAKTLKATIRDLASKANVDLDEK